MATKFNDEQRLAISAEQAEILVAAGAGSGKSTVLVERLMQKILNEKINIDQFLIVTFTNLAAHEMSEKLRASLNQQLSQNPDSKHLQTQILKLPNAYISTFHGFCNKILQRYYYLVDLDANFTLMDDLDATKLRFEVLEDLMEHSYEDDDFKLLVENFGNDRSDAAVAELINKVYEIAVANPDMDEWLENLVNLYYIGNDFDITKWPYYDQIKTVINPLLLTANKQLDEALEIAQSAQMDEVVHNYNEIYHQDKEIIEAVITAVNEQSYNQVRELLQHTNFVRFPSIKKKHWDADLHKTANEMRNMATSIVTYIKDEFYAYTTVTHQHHFTHGKQIVTSIASVVKKFYCDFLSRKLLESKIDFSDLERLTLKILQDNPDVVTEIADDFVEIMIDEYQDTNAMQERIVTILAQAGNVGMFMVGDVKQSIYRFRLAEPSIFQEKYARFKTGNKEELKIDLMQNYRSSRHVIDATNYIFKTLMDAENFEIEYDEDAELKLGIPELDSEFNEPIVNIIDKAQIIENRPEWSQLHDAELEAHFIASQIKNMCNGDKVLYDRKINENRPVEYEDIVILLRGMSSAAKMYDILTSYQIPVAIETAGNLLETTEINTVLSVLRIIDNPEQDIALVATLRSPMYFFTEPELAKIRIATPKVSFYDALKNYVTVATREDELSLRVNEFLLQLNDWRIQAMHTSLIGLVRKIYEQTNYYQFVLGLPGGNERRANLELLETIADDYQNRTAQGLYGFLRYIDQLAALGKTIPKAKVATQVNGVKIMTIHKSKGLEFPVVFMSQIQKQFNTTDEIGNYIIHKNYGVGVQYINSELRLKQKSLVTTVMAKKMRNEMLAEEMRLLYVALTRAKSKLILTGVLKDHDTIAQLSQKDVSEGFVRLGARRFIDWILPLASKKTAASPWSVKIIESVDIINEGTSGTESQQKWPVIDMETAFKDKYPLQELTTITAKQSVTQRKIEETVPLYKGIPERMETVAYDIPSFMQNKTKATEIGTALHQYMQHLPIATSHTTKDLEDLLSRLVEQNIIHAELVSKINLTNVHEFTSSPLYQDLFRAVKIYKELPFTMMFSAGESESAQALLQGVIDLLAEFEDVVWIVDYKTDQVENFAAESANLKARYEIQMKYYLAAVRELYPAKKVLAKVYFMRAGAVIEYV